MGSVRGFFVFVTFSVIMVFRCTADRYPQPWNLTYTWLDSFTVNISWNKPIGLADNSNISYCIDSEIQVPKKKLYTVVTLLTETKHNDSWKNHIWTTGGDCSQSNDGDHTTLTIRTPKPRDEVVKDFKCFASDKKLNCSWIPVDLYQNSKIYYRIKGRQQEDINSLNRCDKPYSNIGRKGCYLHIYPEPENILVLVETDTAMMTFFPVIELPPPKMSVKEEGDYLKLSWDPSDFANHCSEYEVCYSECNASPQCRKIVRQKDIQKPSMDFIYNKNCQYEFISRVMTSEFCFNMSSTFSKPVIYGTNKTPDETLTVVAIVIPIILSACVILSCYCFRRHSAIICPVIPDPSAIFKEMIMNGNSDHKATQKLYTPVPEPTEPCKITLHSPTEQMY